jgi:hypothetical protein
MDHTDDLPVKRIRSLWERVRIIDSLAQNQVIKSQRSQSDHCPNFQTLIAT